MAWNLGSPWPVLRIRSPTLDSPLSFSTSYGFPDLVLLPAPLESQCSREGSCDLSQLSGKGSFGERLSTWLTATSMCVLFF